MTWWGGDDWEFHACVRCGGPLRSALSRKNGYGPGCADASGIKSLVRVKLRAERQAARRAVRKPGGERGRATPHNRHARKALTGSARKSTPRRAELAPTEKQQAYLRALADRAGETFSAPSSRRDASAQIDLLRTRLAEKGGPGTTHAS